MTIAKPRNPNYCASVSMLTTIIPHSNADKLAIAVIQGNHVIIGKDMEIGAMGLFFPLECQLSPEYLSANNLYRDKTKNQDQTKAGFFEENGRIRAVKLRGEKSEGLFMPLESLAFCATPAEICSLLLGQDFDIINGHEICKKYTIPVKESHSDGQIKMKKSIPKESKLVDGQFRLHIDTEKLNKNIHKIAPTDMISITAKFHGTSFVVGNVLAKKKVNPIAKVVYSILGESPMEYQILYSSRNVIKNQYFIPKAQNHFYGYDLWADIAEALTPVIPQGITLYGEAVGYTQGGGMIQKGYHYGTSPGKYDIYIYRVTSTSADGKVVEFSWGQIKDFCRKNGLKAVVEYYYGPAKDCYREVPVDDNWHTNFLNKLNSDVSFGMGDSLCKFNNDEVPSEGIVLKVDNLYEDSVYKLKNFRFLAAETEALDKGIVSMEDSQ